MNEITITDNDLKFMKMACDIATGNVDRGGGPSGAVIVKDGEVIAAAGDSVSMDHDPTAHAVVNAIRRACSLIRHFTLDGSVAYCSCEPCPMCLSALYCAGVSRIYYGNTAADAERIGYGSSRFICNEIGKPHLERTIPCIHIEGTTAIESFNRWTATEDKINN